MDESPRLESLRRRVLSDPASVAFAALAEELRRAGRLPEAIETARVGLARHPAYASARVTLGRALLEAGSVGEARRELEQALASAPENLAALRALADLYRSTGVPTRALDLARRGAALAPQDRDWHRLVQALEPAAATRHPAATTVVPLVPTAARREAPSVAAHAVCEPPPERGSLPAPVPDAAPVIRLVPPEVRPPTRPGLAALEAWLDAIVRERLRGAGPGFPEAGGVAHAEAGVPDPARLR